MGWYTFEDESKKKIVGYSCQKQNDKKKIQEKLDETDPRVQEWLGPKWARKSFQTYEIASIEDLFEANKMCSSMPRWGFRGQSNYNHKLEHALERNLNFAFRKEVGLSKYERRILSEAQRRAHLYYASTPIKDDVLGWFAFLRHQGVPTRLLDISWSIYIACYFAVSSNKKTDGTIWAFNRFNLESIFHTHLFSNEKKMFYKHNMACFIDNYQGPTMDISRNGSKNVSSIDLICDWQNKVPTFFDYSTQGIFHTQGILFAEPSWLSKRQDYQQGAFLFPLNCRYSFQQNLMSMIGLKQLYHNKPAEMKKLNCAKKFSSKIAQNAAIIKFRIPKGKKAELQYQLEKMNIKKSVLFPDSDGLIGMLNDLRPTN